MRPITLVACALTFCTLMGGCKKEEPATARQPADQPKAEGTIVAVGDSLTAGYGVKEDEAYPAQLERKLEAAGYHWKVVNAGISGETSSGALSRIDWILKLKPDIVILETGANDGLRGIDPAVVKRNIDRIVTGLQAHGVEVVLAGMQMLTNMGTGYTTSFVKIYPEAAQAHHLILVPFFLTGVAGDASLNLSDGIHPTANGYKIVTETVYPYTVKAIERKRSKKQSGS
ncbi:arylesterase [Geomonas sp. Red32]|uniref:arylesterase n=1 Tax=Geomonas sp. Red32 TaxID=2912856 RepID=UPI00202CDC13|nr:arylesterase [Geomonas sp. Red32]MCM0081522.1 arylesterase [Geomonas sp. Red32]